MENIRARQLRRWLCCVVAVIGYFLTPATSMWAQGNKPTDYQVKAAYLYNFGRFIEWPPAVTARNDAFNVCILGQDPFGKNLDTTLAGESIAGKHVVAKRISNAEESTDCQILFLSSEEAGHMKQIMDALDKAAILTVSDIPKFSQRGGMIQFVLEGNRIRFEVNLTATQHAGLVLSSELLKVAAAVRKDSVTGD
jgi:hypothetical protein